MTADLDEFLSPTQLVISWLTHLGFKAGRGEASDRRSIAEHGYIKVIPTGGDVDPALPYFSTSARLDAYGVDAPGVKAAVPARPTGPPPKPPSLRAEELAMRVLHLGHLPEGSRPPSYEVAWDGRAFRPKAITLSFPTPLPDLDGFARWSLTVQMFWTARSPKGT